MATIEMTMNLKGTAPLIMHNVQAADPMNHFAREIKAITSKKSNKTDADMVELDRLKFLSGLYFDPELGPVLPCPNVFRCLIEAGSITRDGKNIERGVSMFGIHSKLEYNGPRDEVGLWGDGITSRFVDRRLVTVNRARVPSVRPIFVDWAATFDVIVEDEIIDPEKFAGIASKAGRMIGVGDYRRFYGRFAVEIS